MKKLAQMKQGQTGVVTATVDTKRDLKFDHIPMLEPCTPP